MTEGEKRFIVDSVRRARDELVHNREQAKRRGIPIGTRTKIAADGSTSQVPAEPSGFSDRLDAKIAVADSALAEAEALTVDE